MDSLLGLFYLAAPFLTILYLVIIVRNLWAYFRTKDKTRKKAILHTLLHTYDLWLFATLTLLLLLLPLFHIFYSASSSRPIAMFITVILVVTTLWYILRTIIGIVFWFKYHFTKNLQAKKILRQKLVWGFKGFLLLTVVFIFYAILTIILSLLGYNHIMYSRFTQ